MFVELSIFSGRPDPRWQLDAATAQALADIHRTLAPGPSGHEPPGLGYRGFAYQLDGATWRAFDGTVATTDRVLADPTRSVERFLRTTLPAPFADLEPRLTREIEG